MDIVHEFENDVQNSLLTLCDDLRNKNLSVALSGGADSVCLLTVLRALSKKLKFKVFAIHVNHMIRGEEADRDEAFCVALCRRKRVKLDVVHKDVPLMAKEKGESLELCARNVRYNSFEAHRIENQIDFVCTAHNANDNAETVLYNVIRGAGSDGLRGIPQKRGCIIRPILKKTREEILAYLSAVGEDYVTDSTNNENDYSRNYIRNVMLPAAKHINPGVIESLNRLSSAAEEDRTFFEEALRPILNKYNSRVDLKKLSPALQKRAIKSLFARQYSAQLESAHINAICRNLRYDAEKCVSLPDNVNAVTCNGTLSFYDANGRKPKLVETVLREGENYVAGIFVRIEVSYGPFRPEVNLPDRYMFSVSLDKEKIKGNLCVRQRRTGDSFVVRKINRNIKKCFINNKVPASVRDKVPIIYDDEGIVFVPFIGAADRVYSKKGKEACNITVVFNERVGQR